MSVNSKISKASKSKGKSYKGTPMPLSIFLSPSSVDANVAESLKVTKLLQGQSEIGGGDVEMPQTVVVPREFREWPPPFIAFLNNLPFEASEQEVRALFDERCIRALHLPLTRNVRQPRRNRGFAYLELETSDDLMALLKMQIFCRERRLRIEVSSSQQREANTNDGNVSIWMREPPTNGFADASSEGSSIDLSSELEFPELRAKLSDMKLKPKCGEQFTEAELQERMQQRLELLAELENKETATKPVLGDADVVEQAAQLFAVADEQAEQVFDAAVADSDPDEQQMLDKYCFMD